MSKGFGRHHTVHDLTTLRITHTGLTAKAPHVRSSHARTTVDQQGNAVEARPFIKRRTKRTRKDIIEDEEAEALAGTGNPPSPSVRPSEDPDLEHPAKRRKQGEQFYPELLNLLKDQSGSAGQASSDTNLPSSVKNSPFPLPSLTNNNSFNFFSHRIC